MSNNKSLKEKMIAKYGAECWIEEEGIRYIPDVLDLERKGRSEEDNRLTLHHIKPVHERSDKQQKKMEQ